MIINFKLRLNLSLLLLSITISIYSQNNQFSQLTNYFIYSDTKGFTWISSIDGLNRFDGINVKIYRPGGHNLIGSNIQSGFYEDEKSNIWFTTYEALHIYFRSIDNFEYIQLTSSSGDTIRNDYKIFYQNGDSLFLKAGNYFFIYDRNKLRVVYESTIDLNAFESLGCIRNQNEIRIAGGDQKGLHLINFGKPDSVKNILTGESILDFKVENDSIIWCALGSKGIAKVNYIDFSYQIIPIGQNLSISHIFISKDGNLYLSAGLKAMVYNYKNQTIEKIFENDFNIPGSIPIGTICPIIIDRNDILWIPVDGKGPFSFSLKKPKFTHLMSSSDFYRTNKNNVRSFIELPNGELWFCTRTWGIQVINQSGNWLRDYNTFNGKLNVNFIYDIFQDNYGNILALSSGDLFVYKPELDLFVSTELPNKKNHFFTKGLILPNHQTLLSDAWGGAWIFKEINCKFSIEKFDSTLSKKIIGCFLDKNNNLYLDDNNQGILFYKKSKDNYFFYKNLNIPGGIYDLSDEVLDSFLYLSNPNGLFKISKNNDSFKKVIDNNNYLNQTIYSVIPDEHNNLWLSSNKGILKYNKQTDEVRAYTIADGLQGLEFNSLSGGILKDGRFLFGGLHGINVFRPEEIKDMDYQAPAHLLEMKVNDEDFKTPQNIEVMDRIDLSYSQNTVSFKFVGIDMSNPDNVQLKYNLKGQDDKWVQTTNQNGFARYSNLKPGTYTFQIMASNSDGVWNPVPRTFDLTITPPYWMTWWFRGGAIMSILGLGLLVFRAYYQRQLEKKDLVLREQRLIIDKQSAVEKERNRIASEMHDDLGSGLTTIRYLSDRALKNVKSDEEKNQIQRIAEQSNSLIRNMSEIIWAMNARYDNLENLMGYIRRHASEFLEEHKIKLEWNQTQIQEGIKLSGEKRRNVFLVCKESLNNIAKHSKATFVKISVTLQEDQIQISILDNGIGFNPDTKADKGNGLYYMNKRMEQISGKLMIQSDSKGSELILTFSLS